MAKKRVAVRRNGKIFTRLQFVKPKQVKLALQSKRTHCGTCGMPLNPKGHCPLCSLIFGTH